MKMQTVKTIWVTKEGYLYLQDYSLRCKTGHGLSEQTVDRLSKNFGHLATRDGYREVLDKSYRGYSGKYLSCSDMKRLLKNKGLPFKEGETEVINL